MDMWNVVYYIRYGYVKFSIPYTIKYLCVLFVEDGVNHWPRRFIRRYAVLERNTGELMVRNILWLVKGYAWQIITGSGSDDWIYFCFLTITLSYTQYSAIVYLHTFHFLIAHTLGQSPLVVSWQRIYHRKYHFKSLWILLVISPSITLDCLLSNSPILILQSPWFLTLYSSVLIWTQLSQVKFKVKVRVTLRRAVCRQSDVGVKPLETHDRRFF
jgi:hypothetical protein